VADVAKAKQGVDAAAAEVEACEKKLEDLRNFTSFADIKQLLEVKLDGFMGSIAAMHQQTEGRLAKIEERMGEVETQVVMLSRWGCGNECALELAAGWFEYGGCYGAASCSKIEGEVTVSGLIKNGAWGKLAVLPVGSRPSKRQLFNLNVSNQTARVDVLTNGEIHWVGGSKVGSWISLEGISFSLFAATDLPLAPGWSAYGGDYGTPSFSQTTSGVVTVSGLIKDGAWGKLAVLPVGSRPSKRLLFNLNVSNQTARVDVLTNGEIHWVGGSKDGSWISLSGIKFVGVL
jgi:hypothetical protein